MVVQPIMISTILGVVSIVSALVRFHCLEMLIVFPSIFNFLLVINLRNIAIFVPILLLLLFPVSLL